MPYPNFPIAYPNQYSPYQQSTNSASLVWVQGESGAKAYPVAPGNSVLLLDSESDRFFIKSSDASGMPLPLRVFTYSENAENATTSSISQNIDLTDYVTREEFNTLVEKIAALSKQQKEYPRKEKQTNNGKPLIH